MLDLGTAGVWINEVVRSVRLNGGGSGFSGSAWLGAANDNGPATLLVRVGSSLGSRSCNVMKGTAVSEGIGATALMGGDGRGPREGMDSPCLARALWLGGVMRRCASTTAASCEKRHRSPYKHAPWTMCLHASRERST